MCYKDWFFSRFTISNVKWYFRTKKDLKEGRCSLVDGYTNIVFYKEKNATCILNPFKRCDNKDKKHKKEQVRKGQVKCSYCNNWVDKDKAFAHINGEDHCCIDCY